MIKEGILNYDKKSVKIFKYLYGTDKNVNLYGISGDDYEKVDVILDKIGTYTQIDPMHNDFLPHVTCEEYFKHLLNSYTCTDIENGKLVNKVGTIVFYYPETGMSIRDQQRFMDMLVSKLLKIDGIEQDEFDIVVVTNSLWILSDVPSSNVTVFNLEECRGEGIYFGGNLIDILSNFSPDIMQGRLSANYMSKLIKIANKHEKFEDEELIEFIGDKLIKGYIESKMIL